MEFSKQDWALFRKKIALWQEAYMERLNQEYMDILSGQGNPSDKFWLLEKRIKTIILFELSKLLVKLNRNACRINIAICRKPPEVLEAFDNRGVKTDGPASFGICRKGEKN